MNKVQDKIRVAHLIGSTGLYGAERWILALMRAMDTDRVQSTLVNLVDAENETSAVAEAARERGLDALDFYTGGSFNPLAAWRLSRWLKLQEIAIVHGHGFKSDVAGWLAGRMARCKVVTTPHGWSLEADRKLQFYELMDKFLFRFMDGVCPLSEALYSGIQSQVKPSRLHLIFNGVDIDEVRSVPAAKIGTESSYTLGYIGQLIERKDLFTLIDSVKNLTAKNMKVRLLIVGEGVKKTDLEAEVRKLGLSEQIEFLGFRADAAGILKTFDLFVLPSLLEGIPRCIMEALAASVPVVVSDIPGNRALVVDGETGLLFKPGDSAELASKIRFMLEHPDLGKTMAAAGARKVEEEYSNRRMAREYAALYHDVLGKPIL